MNKPIRLLSVIVISIVLLILASSLFGPQQNISGLLSGTAPKKLSYGEFDSYLQSNDIATVLWQQKTIEGTFKDGGKYTAYVDMNPDSAGAVALKAEIMRQKNDGKITKFSTEPPPAYLGFISALVFILPMVLLGLFFYFFMIRPAQNGGNQAMNFGRSRAKRANESSPKVTFEDVAGIDEAKEELFEVVDYLKNTKKYVALGAKIPKGVLLTGPPGVGKTHLARAVAGEAGVPFFHISGSDFVEMFVGVGAARVRDLFETAKAHKPCLIFIDEIDAVGRQRGTGLGGGHDEREQTLNQLLVEMDGFEPNNGIIVIAATNRSDVLDPALLRPGRFDRQVTVDAPDAKGREAILKIHAKGKPLEDKVELGTLAKRTPGFTGADLANALNEAALLAARRGRTKIAGKDLEEAVDRVVAGPERKSRVMNDEERRVIAYHEAGHAVVGELMDLEDPVHKVTILPRGGSLGSTWHLPDMDRKLSTQNRLLDKICGLLGGRVAEEIVIGDVTTGAYSDLQRVAHIARAMVTDYGMSEKLGTMAIGRPSRNPFLGRDHGDDLDYSEEVARMIDEEVRGIVENQRTRAHNLLTEHRDKLDAVANALLDQETIDRDEFLALMAGQTLPAKESQEAIPPTAAPSDRTGSAQPAPRLEPGPA